jgi:prevent-host-death family protein
MSNSNDTSIIGLKELRDRLPEFIERVEQGKSFVIVKHSKPVFKMSPVEEEELWEPVVDFTSIKAGGVDIEDILSRLD